MGFSAGFLGPRGNAGFSMIFDEEKARKIVSLLIDKGMKVSNALVGLDGDWDMNSATLFEDGGFVEDVSFYDKSIWAKPTLIVNFEDRPSRAYEVWKAEAH